MKIIESSDSSMIRVKTQQGVDKMKQLLWVAILLALATVVPIPTMAQIDINVGISLPPPIVFQAPPEVIVMPDTSSVYVVPDINAEMFFWNG